MSDPYHAIEWVVVPSGSSSAVVKKVSLVETKVRRVDKEESEKEEGGRRRKKTYLGDDVARLLEVLALTADARARQKLLDEPDADFPAHLL